MMSLSKKAIDMLGYNGYSVKISDQSVDIRKSRGETGCLVVLVLIASIICFVVLMSDFKFGIITILISILVILLVSGSLKNNPCSSMDLKKRHFKIDDGETSIRWQSMDLISGVYIHSKFVDEYSSAFKSTSEEHLITIGLVLSEKQLVPLFRLISDHAKPSREMNEVHDFLESIIRTGKQNQNT